MSIRNLENIIDPFPNNDISVVAPTTPNVSNITPITTSAPTDFTDLDKSTTIASAQVIPPKIASLAKTLDISRSHSDSGKSSSCSPTLLDCSFDSGIAGVLLDSNDMQLHKRIQQCQRILLALERDREHFCTIRNRLSKVTDRRKKQTDNEYLCNVCCAEIDPEDAKTFVKCYICHKHICRSIKCADWLPKTAQWECELCQTSKESMAQTSSWVADQISFHQEKLVYPLRARSEIFIPISECNDSSIHFESVSQIGANSATVTAEQKLKIREYVEEVVANLLGGNLDTISVNQLSKSENYLPAPKTNGHLKQNGSIITNHSEAYQEVTPTSTNSPDFTDISETRLRLMIQKIIAETINMPPLSPKHAVSEISLDRRGKTSDNMSLTNGHRYRTEHYFEPKIYQDLLATAVLNKIVDKQLNNHGMLESSSNLTRGDGGGDVDNSAVRHAILDQNFNMENQSTTSGSSVEPHSDCSYTDMEQMINANDDKTPDLIISAGRESVMSDYLASHMVPLPDLSTMATESEEDDYMSVTSSAVGDGTWENNWLFKKKKPTLGGTVAASSVGMLVPDPKEDVRAQIGDKTADEVSDLSELGSDTDDSLEILRTKLDPINDRLINKHLIGGQNNKLVLDELIERSSMISNTMPTDLEQAYTETRNEHVIEASATTEAINADVNQQNNNNSIEQEEAEAILPPAGFEDPSSNPLTAGDDFTESDGCTGFSTIEILEPDVRTHSVVEILAAMALGPMLAVPAIDQPTALTVSEFEALNELKDLALAEIKARSLELTPHSLSVIPEEPGEHSIDLKNFPTPDELSEEIINDFERGLITAVDFSNLESDISVNDSDRFSPTAETDQKAAECPETKNEAADETQVLSTNVQDASAIEETIECFEIISKNIDEIKNEEIIKDFEQGLLKTADLSNLESDVSVNEGDTCLPSEEFGQKTIKCSETVIEAIGETQLISTNIQDPSSSQKTIECSESVSKDLIKAVDLSNLESDVAVNECKPFSPPEGFQQKTMECVEAIIESPDETQLISTKIQDPSPIIQDPSSIENTIACSDTVSKDLIKAVDLSNLVSDAAVNDCETFASPEEIERKTMACVETIIEAVDKTQLISTIIPDKSSIEKTLECSQTDVAVNDSPPEEFEQKPMECPVSITPEIEMLDPRIEALDEPQLISTNIQDSSPIIQDPSLFENTIECTDTVSKDFIKAVDLSNLESDAAANDCETFASPEEIEQKTIACVETIIEAVDETQLISTNIPDTSSIEKTIECSQTDVAVNDLPPEEFDQKPMECPVSITPEIEMLDPRIEALDEPQLISTNIQDSSPIIQDPSLFENTIECSDNVSKDFIKAVDLLNLESDAAVNDCETFASPEEIEQKTLACVETIIEAVDETQLISTNIPDTSSIEKTIECSQTDVAVNDSPTEKFDQKPMEYPVSITPENEMLEPKIEALDETQLISTNIQEIAVISEPMEKTIEYSETVLKNMDEIKNEDIRNNFAQVLTKVESNLQPDVAMNDCNTFVPPTEFDQKTLECPVPTNPEIGILETNVKSLDENQSISTNIENTSAISKAIEKTIECFETVSKDIEEIKNKEIIKECEQALDLSNLESYVAVNECETFSPPEGFQQKTMECIEAIIESADETQLISTKIQDPSPIIQDPSSIENTIACSDTVSKDLIKAVDLSNLVSDEAVNECETFASPEEFEQKTMACVETIIEAVDETQLISTNILDTSSIEKTVECSQTDVAVNETFSPPEEFDQIPMECLVSITQEIKMLDPKIEASDETQLISTNIQDIAVVSEPIEKTIDCSENILKNMDEIKNEGIRNNFAQVLTKVEANLQPDVAVDDCNTFVPPAEFDQKTLECPAPTNSEIGILETNVKAFDDNQSISTNIENTSDIAKEIEKTIECFETVSKDMEEVKNKEIIDFEQGVMSDVAINNCNIFSPPREFDQKNLECSVSIKSETEILKSIDETQLKLENIKDTSAISDPIEKTIECPETISKDQIPAQVNKAIDSNLESFETNQFSPSLIELKQGVEEVTTLILNEKSEEGELNPSNEETNSANLSQTSESKLVVNFGEDILESKYSLLTETNIEVRNDKITDQANIYVKEDASSAIATEATLEYTEQCSRQPNLTLTEDEIIINSVITSETTSEVSQTTNESVPIVFLSAENVSIVDNTSDSISTISETQAQAIETQAPAISDDYVPLESEIGKQLALNDCGTFAPPEEPVQTTMDCPETIIQAIEKTQLTSKNVHVTSEISEPIKKNIEFSATILEEEIKNEEIVKDFEQDIIKPVKLSNLESDVAVNDYDSFSPSEEFVQKTLECSVPIKSDNETLETKIKAIDETELIIKNIQDTSAISEAIEKNIECSETISADLEKTTPLVTEVINTNLERLETILLSPSLLEVKPANEDITTLVLTETSEDMEQITPLVTEAINTNLEQLKSSNEEITTSISTKTPEMTQVANTDRDILESKSQPLTKSTTEIMEDKITDQAEETSSASATETTLEYNKHCSLTEDQIIINSVITSETISDDSQTISDTINDFVPIVLCSAENVTMADTTSDFISVLTKETPALAISDDCDPQRSDSGNQPSEKLTAHVDDKVPVSLKPLESSECNTESNTVLTRNRSSQTLVLEDIESTEQHNNESILDVKSENSDIQLSVESISALPKDKCSQTFNVSKSNIDDVKETINKPLETSKMLDDKITDIVLSLNKREDNISQSSVSSDILQSTIQFYTEEKISEEENLEDLKSVEQQIKKSNLEQREEQTFESSSLECLKSDISTADKPSLAVLPENTPLESFDSKTQQAELKINETILDSKEPISILNDDIICKQEDEIVDSTTQPLQESDSTLKEDIIAKTIFSEASESRIPANLESLDTHTESTSFQQTSGEYTQIEDNIGETTLSTTQEKSNAALTEDEIYETATSDGSECDISCVDNSIHFSKELIPLVTTDDNCTKTPTAECLTSERQHLTDVIKEENIFVIDTSADSELIKTNNDQNTTTLTQEISDSDSRPALLIEQIHVSTSLMCSQSALPIEDIHESTDLICSQQQDSKEESETEYTETVSNVKSVENLGPALIDDDTYETANSEGEESDKDSTTALAIVDSIILKQKQQLSETMTLEHLKSDEQYSPTENVTTSTKPTAQLSEILSGDSSESHTKLSEEDNVAISQNASETNDQIITKPTAPSSEIASVDSSESHTKLSEEHNAAISQNASETNEQIITVKTYDEISQNLQSQNLESAKHTGETLVPIVELSPGTKTNEECSDTIVKSQITETDLSVDLNTNDVNKSIPLLTDDKITETLALESLKFETHSDEDSNEVLKVNQNLEAVPACISQTNPEYISMPLDEKNNKTIPEQPNVLTMENSETQMLVPPAVIEQCNLIPTENKIIDVSATKSEEELFEEPVKISKSNQEFCEIEASEHSKSVIQTMEEATTDLNLNATENIPLECLTSVIQRTKAMNTNSSETSENKDSTIQPTEQFTPVSIEDKTECISGIDLAKIYVPIGTDISATKPSKVSISVDQNIEISENEHLTTVTKTEGETISKPMLVKTTLTDSEDYSQPVELCSLVQTEKKSFESESSEPKQYFMELVEESSEKAAEVAISVSQSAEKCIVVDTDIKMSEALPSVTESSTNSTCLLTQNESITEPIKQSFVVPDDEKIHQITVLESTQHSESFEHSREILAFNTDTNPTEENIETIVQSQFTETDLSVDSNTIDVNKSSPLPTENKITETLALESLKFDTHSDEDSSAGLKENENLETVPSCIVQTNREHISEPLEDKIDKKISEQQAVLTMENAETQMSVSPAVIEQCNLVPTDNKITEVSATKSEELFEQPVKISKSNEEFCEIGVSDHSKSVIQTLDEATTDLNLNATENIHLECLTSVIQSIEAMNTNSSETSENKDSTIQPIEQCTPVSIEDKTECMSAIDVAKISVPLGTDISATKPNKVSISVDQNIEISENEHLTTVTETEGETISKPILKNTTLTDSEDYRQPVELCSLVQTEQKSFESESSESKQYFLELEEESSATEVAISVSQSAEKCILEDTDIKMSETLASVTESLTNSACLLTQNESITEPIKQSFVVPGDEKIHQITVLESTKHSESSEPSSETLAFNPDTNPTEENIETIVKSQITETDLSVDSNTIDVDKSSPLPTENKITETLALESLKFDTHSDKDSSAGPKENENLETVPSCIVQTNREHISDPLEDKIDNIFPEQQAVLTMENAETQLSKELFAIAQNEKTEQLNSVSTETKISEVSPTKSEEQLSDEEPLNSSKPNETFCKTEASNHSKSVILTLEEPTSDLNPNITEQASLECFEPDIQSTNTKKQNSSDSSLTTDIKPITRPNETTEDKTENVISGNRAELISMEPQFTPSITEHITIDKKLEESTTVECSASLNVPIEVSSNEAVVNMIPEAQPFPENMSIENLPQEPVQLEVATELPTKLPVQIQDCLDTELPPEENIQSEMLFIELPTDDSAASQACLVAKLPLEEPIQSQACLVLELPTEEPTRLQDCLDAAMPVQSQVSLDNELRTEEPIQSQACLVAELPQKDSTEKPVQSQVNFKLPTEEPVQSHGCLVTALPTEEHIDAQACLTEELHREEVVEKQVSLVTELSTENPVQLEVSLVTEFQTEEPIKPQACIVAKLPTEHPVQSQMSLVTDLLTEDPVQLKVSLVTELLTEDTMQSQACLVSQLPTEELIQSAEDSVQLESQACFVTELVTEKPIQSESCLVAELPTEHTVQSQLSLVSDLSTEEPVILKVNLVAELLTEESVQSQTCPVAELPTEDPIQSDVCLATELPIKDPIQSQACLEAELLTASLLTESPKKEPAQLEVSLPTELRTKEAVQLEVYLVTELTTETPIQSKACPVADLSSEERVQLEKTLVIELPTEESNHSQASIVAELPTEKPAETQLPSVTELPAEETVQSKACIVRELPTENPIRMKSSLVAELLTESSPQSQASSITQLPTEVPVQSQDCLVSELLTEEPVPSEVPVVTESNSLKLPTEENVQLQAFNVTDLSTEETAQKQVSIVAEQPTEDSVQLEISPVSELSTEEPIQLEVSLVIEPIQSQACIVVELPSEEPVDLERTELPTEELIQSQACVVAELPTEEPIIIEVSRVKELPSEEPVDLECKEFPTEELIESHACVVSELPTEKAIQSQDCIVTKLPTEEPIRSKVSLVTEIPTEAPIQSQVCRVAELRIEQSIQTQACLVGAEEPEQSQVSLVAELSTENPIQSHACPSEELNTEESIQSQACLVEKLPSEEPIQSQASLSAELLTEVPVQSQACLVTELPTEEPFQSEVGVVIKTELPADSSGMNSKVSTLESSSSVNNPEIYDAVALATVQNVSNELCISLVNEELSTENTKHVKSDFNTEIATDIAIQSKDAEMLSVSQPPELVLTLEINVLEVSVEASTDSSTTVPTTSLRSITTPTTNTLAQDVSLAQPSTAPSTTEIPVSESLDYISINISTDEPVSFDETLASPSITRQSTVVEIEHKPAQVDDITKDTAPQVTHSVTTAQSLGNSNVFRKLQRQCRVEDTTPSFEDVCQLPRAQSPNTSTNSLANLCQKYIRDKHLLAALEKRRRQTLLMHRFLSTLDSFNSNTDDRDSVEEETIECDTEVLTQIPDRPPPPPTPVVNDHDSDDNDDNDSSDSFNFKVNEQNTMISYNFINNVLFSDQLSHDSNHIDDESRTNTVEEYIENDTNDEKDILFDKFNSIITTTHPTNTTTITNTTTSKDKHRLTSTNGTSSLTKATKPNKRSERKSNSSLIPLTSAVQNQFFNPPLFKFGTRQHVYNLQCLSTSSTDSNDDDDDDDDDDDVNEVVDEVEMFLEDNEGDDDGDEVAMLRHFVPGSIAEREYKKWNNAVEMPNNPYAPEALKRRISGSQERFIDLPNISPIKEQNPLELIDKGKLEVDETDKRESDYRRYSRDYYINNSSPSSQTSTPRETPATPTKDNLEITKATKSPATKQTDIDLYKAIPAQVVEDKTSSIDTISQQSIQSGNTTTSDDSDTIKIYDFKKQETTVLRESKTPLEKEPVKDIKPKERPTVLNFSRSESAGNVTTPTRGSTPTAFKFLQPKRKIFDPSQVLSLDDDAAPDVKSPPEKPVIEQEVAQALPSVKALAKAFLMTTKSSQSENRWLRKARTLSHGEKGKPPTPVRSLDPTPSEIVKIEEDLTITSDLSSLETDSSLVYKDGENTKDIPETPLSPTADCTTPITSTSGNTSPVLVRQGGLKNNIAFFENLKFK